jgi:hypothetical protein
VYPETSNVFLAKRADPPRSEFDPWNRLYLGTF